MVGIDPSRFEQWFPDTRRETTLFGEIIAHAFEVGKILHRQAWTKCDARVQARRSWRRVSGGRWRGCVASKLLLEPSNCRLAEMEDPQCPGRTLEWTRIVDFYHATEYIAKLAGVKGKGLAVPP